MFFLPTLRLQATQRFRLGAPEMAAMAAMAHASECQLLGGFHSHADLS